MKINYVEGDLFNGIRHSEAGTVILPHICNDRGVMGAGFVISLAREFPLAKESYLRWCKSDKNSDFPFELGRTQYVPNTTENKRRVIVCNMVAQNGTGGPRAVRYNHLARCLDEVAAVYFHEPNSVIHCPMFGAGLGGGNWNFIEQLIVDAWLRRGVDVTVYYLPGTLPQNWTLPSVS